MKKLFLILPLALLVGGCVGAVPWNPQGYAGINKVVFEWKLNDEGISQPVRVTITDGKEMGAIDFSFKMQDGTLLNFAAENVLAFPGQDIRAGVEKQVSGDVAGVFEKAIDLAGAIVAPVPGPVPPDDVPDGGGD